MGITGAWLVAVVVAGVVVALIVLRAAWARHLRRYGVGPVDVVPPSNGTGESDDLVRPLAQAAVIVSRLAGDGLYPAPALPSGAMATGLIDVVQASPISEARWIGTILSYLKDSFARRPTGFRLAGTLLRGDESPSCGYLAQMSAVGNAADPEVRTFWEDSYEAAAERVAGFAYAVAVRARDRATSPVWANWVSSDGTSIMHYQHGLDFEHRADVKAAEGRIIGRLRAQATEQYELAAMGEPDQALVRLRYANVQERADNWVAALSVYYRESEKWPELFDARYRLGIVLSFATKVHSQIEALRRTRVSLEEQRSKLDFMNQLYARHYRDPGVTFGTAAMTRTIAQEELVTLHRETSWFGCLRTWTESLLPAHNYRRARHELAALARPWSRVRLLRRYTTQTAIYCTQLGDRVMRDRDYPRLAWKRLILGRLAMQPSRRRIRRYLAWWRPQNWQLRYNVTCCYSRLLALNEQLQDEVRSVNTGIQGRARRPPLLRGTSSDEWLQILGNVHNVVRGALGQLNSGFLEALFRPRVSRTRIRLHEVTTALTSEIRHGRSDRADAGKLQTSGQAWSDQTMRVLEWTHRELEKRAMEQLSRAFREAGEHLEVAWIRDDPDLEALRHTPDMTDWLLRFGSA